MPLDCECNKFGSNGVNCKPDDGQCNCKPNIKGKHCHECKDGFYDFPNCYGNWFEIL